ncbi:hypothetical protein BBJ29_001316 [Phytophthora kernoviae]|uniref:ATP-dependent helicase CHD1-2/hrp3 HTH domain-containing protein n=1 Tax=Phytophthora kernoviae TaxID=325452 RepID=A0A421FX72_9STRA|nr:hypothetical protein BBJ29_001316 [Phytophthora kernoviae]
MPLGTRKRDRRTIEEIQRDLRDKRKKPLSSGTLTARSSPPPRGSPVRSPEAEAVVNSGAPMAVGDVAQRAKQAVEARPPHDNIKIFEVEARASQIIERLYENLKLRVAVQRALRTAGCSSGNAQANAQGAYVLVAKQSDLAVLGVHTRDLPSWTWAEKEHDWSQRKDAALLLGVYVHGFGGWEDILNDDLLHFQGQRALKGERLKKRAENLLKRLPAPDLDAGDPRIVQLANSLSNSAANSNQSLGAQFSAIIQSGAIPGVTASTAPSLATGGGRMQRAAERLAARQQNGEDVSIGRRNVAQNNGTGNNNGQGTDKRQPKTPPVSSRVQDDTANDEPEDGEKHRNSSSDSTGKKDKRKKEQRRSNPSGQKTEPDAPAEVPSVAADVAPLPLLSTDDCYDKWKPNKKLREIRQVLKKMKIMAEWSRNQKDETVVEKVFKYVSTIGEAIDRIVAQHEDKIGDNQASASNGTLSSREADELCTCLWTYAAGFTPFTAQGFERLYDDICADGDALVAAGS